MRNKIALISLPVLVIVLAVILYIFFISPDKAVKPSVNPSQNNTTSDQPAAKKPFDKTRYSFAEPSSIWVVVNKKRPLPTTYTPEDLVTVSSGQMRKDAAAAMNLMLDAGKAAGYPMYIISSYRSYGEQMSTYNGYVAKDGSEKADTYSARPGFSEHQTGLAADLGNGTCNLEVCFGQTEAGKWLAKHAFEYGFILRYPEGKDSLTGYQYEPWHFRYVGVDLAKQLKASGQTLEQFFGLPLAPKY